MRNPPGMAAMVETEKQIDTELSSCLEWSVGWASGLYV